MFSFFWVVARRTFWFFAEVSGYRICPTSIDKDDQDANLTLQGGTDYLSRNICNNPTSPSNPEVLRYPRCRFFSFITWCVKWLFTLFSQNLPIVDRSSEHKKRCHVTENRQAVALFTCCPFGTTHKAVTLWPWHGSIVSHFKVRSALHNPALRTTQGCLSPHITEYRAETLNRNCFVYDIWLYGRERVVFYSMTLSNSKIIVSVVDEWHVCTDRWWNEPDMDSPITGR
jgi:hypothetical protein